MNIKTVKVTKISILGNQENCGYFTNPPRIGERFILTPISFGECQDGITTGPVLEILPDNTFKTSNATYKYEYI